MLVLVISMKKFIFIIIFLAVIKLCDIEFMTKDLNVANIVSDFASNLYEYDSQVAKEEIDVIDYSFDDEGVWITPVKNEVVLPIRGIITFIGKDYIDIQSSSFTYRIYDVDTTYYLYQFYKEGSILGTSQMYYVQTDDFSSIVSHLVINYEAV